MGKQVLQSKKVRFRIKPFTQEVGGTFFLIFWTCLLCWLMEISNFPVKWDGGLNGSDLGPWFLLALVFALTYIPLLWLLCFVFHRSSAHFNPAVTFACWANKDIEFRRAFYNILAQFVGAVLAGAAIYVLAGLATPESFNHNGVSQWRDPTTLGITSIKPVIYEKVNDPISFHNPKWPHFDVGIIAGPLSQFIGFVIEFVGFGIFMFLILNSGWLSKKVIPKSNPKTQTYLGTLFVSIGLAFFVFIEIPETGASLNPFRSLAPVIFQSWGCEGEIGWSYMWIYFAAPILAGLAAALVNRRVHKIHLDPIF